MTLKEIIVEIFEALGEPSDLDFWTDRVAETIDTTSAGWKRLVACVNDGMTAIANWKWPSGRQVRLRLLETSAIFKTKALSGTLGGTSAAWTVSGLPTGFGLHVGKLMVGSTSGAAAVVIWSNGTSVITTTGTGTFTVGETVKLYQRRFRWVASSSGYDISTVYGIPYIAAEGVPLEILSVTDLDTQTTLDRTSKSEPLLAPSPIVGVPTIVNVVASGVDFDVYPVDDRVYLVRAMRNPKPLTVADSANSPELPVQFHKGLVLYGIWWFLRRGQESNDAYSTKKDLEEFMARTKTEYDHQDELVDGQVKIYPEGR